MHLAKSGEAWLVNRGMRGSVGGLWGDDWRFLTSTNEMNCHFFVSILGWFWKPCADVAATLQNQ